MVIIFNLKDLFKGESMDSVIDIKKANSEELLDIKKWYFYENVRLIEEKQRLENVRQELEGEKKRFENEVNSIKRQIELKEHHLKWEKELFDKKWNILQSEVKRLAKDADRIREEKLKLEQEKKEYKRLRNNSRNTHSQVFLGDLTDVFFQGVTSKEALKKRYKDLNKIYHPDNMGGDTRIIQEINKSYNIRKKSYSM